MCNYLILKGSTILHLMLAHLSFIIFQCESLFEWKNSETLTTDTWSIWDWSCHKTLHIQLIKFHQHSCSSLASQPLAYMINAYNFRRSRMGWLWKLEFFFFPSCSFMWHDFMLCRERIKQRLALYRGVLPIYMQFSNDAEETFSRALKLLVVSNLLATCVFVHCDHHVM